MRPVIHSTKHYNQFTLSNVAASAITAVDIVDAVAVVDKNLSKEVEEGATVKAVFFEFWLQSDDAAVSAFFFNIEKQSSTMGSMTAAQGIVLNDYANKKNILFQSQGLLPNNTGNPIPVIRQWLKIPRGKQRFGLGDRLRVNIGGIGNGVNFCATTVYKEYN